MSFTVIPNSGPLGRDYLDDLRVGALRALDSAPAGSVPVQLLRYTRALEAEYLNRRDQESRKILDRLWEQRTEQFAGGDADNAN